MREQPIRVPPPGQVGSQRERPTISSVNLFSGPTRNVSSVLGSLAQATGTLVDIQRREASLAAQADRAAAADQEERYAELVESIEQRETAVALAQKEGDQEAVETIYKEILDLTTTGTEDGTFTTQQRTQLQGRLQNYTNDDVARIQRREQLAREAYVTSFADSVETTVTSQFADPETIDTFVQLGVKGSQLYAPVESSVTDAMLTILIEDNSLSAEEAGDIMATKEFQTARKNIIRGIVTGVDTIRASESRSLEAAQRDADTRLIAGDRSKPFSERQRILTEDFRLDPDKARGMVADSVYQRALGLVPTNKAELTSLVNALYDPTLQIPDAQRNEAMQQVAASLVRRVTQNMTVDQIRSGVGVADRLAGPLSTMGITVSWDESGKPKFRGQTTEGELKYLAALAPFLSKEKERSPERAVISSPSVGDDVLKVFDPVGLVSTVDSPNGYTVYQNFIAAMDQAAPGVFTPEALNDLEVNLDTWRRTKFTRDSAEHLAFSSLFGKNVASWMHHSTAIPAGVGNYVREAFVAGSDAQIALAYEMIAENDRVWQAAKTGAAPDVAYAMDEFRTLMKTDVNRLNIDRGLTNTQMFGEFRKRHAAIQSTVAAFNQDPALRRDAINKLSKTTLKDFPLLQFPIEAQSSLMVYMSAVYQNNPNLSGADILNESVAMARADGVTPYVANTSNGGGTLGMLRSPNAIDVTTQTDIRSALAKIGSRRSGLFASQTRSTAIPGTAAVRRLVYGSGAELPPRKTEVFVRNDNFVSAIAARLEDQGVSKSLAAGMAGAMAGKGGEFLITQTEGQAIAGGATLVFNLPQGTEGAQVREHVAVEPWFIEALITISQGN